MSGTGITLYVVLETLLIAHVACVVQLFHV